MDNSPPIPTHEGVGQAPGKVILLGEHAVVYGHPALAASVGLHLQARVKRLDRGPWRLSLTADDVGARLEALPFDPSLTHAGLPEALHFGVAEAIAGVLKHCDAAPGHYHVHVSSELPLGCGMGSSAALAVAMVRAIAALEGGWLEPAEVARRANLVEEVFHGTPSGVDVATIAQGGVIRFLKGPPLRASAVQLRAPLPAALIDSGEVGATRELVAKVRLAREANAMEVDACFDALAALTELAHEALALGDLRSLGEAMSAAHGHLRTLGVSTPSLDRICTIAQSEGALGAKLTGAGGGGLALVLANDLHHAEHLAASARLRGHRAWTAMLGFTTQPQPIGDSQ